MGYSRVLHGAGRRGRGERRGQVVGHHGGHVALLSSRPPERPDVIAAHAGEAQQVDVGDGGCEPPLVLAEGSAHLAQGRVSGRTVAEWQVECDGDLGQEFVGQ